MGALVILDTNIVLDVFIFSDAATLPVAEGLRSGALDWLATQPMRDELERVLDYAQIAPRLAFYQLAPSDVLAAFDRHARLVDIAPKAPMTCRDADDQKFIDLAVLHQCLLLSKDRQVLRLARRMAAWGAAVRSVL